VDTKEQFSRLRRTGDPRLREQLVERHLPLARRMARRYSRSRDSGEELGQVAALGLVKAVDRYDPRRGASFTSFAVPTILGELRRHLRDTRWAVHVPRELQERAQTVTREADRLVTALGRAPSAADVAGSLGTTVEEVVDAREAAFAIGSESLDAPAASGGEAEGDSAGDRLGGVDPGYELVEDRNAIDRAAACLSTHDRAILRMRFAGGMTQSQIGARLGISQMHVSRTLRRVLTRLRTAAGADSRLAA
jgi:RNA polymerase sigma-B factor